MTLRASRMGFLIRVSPATAPARKLDPSMIEASSSLVPSAVNTAPFPALKCGESSNMVITVVTASRASPPDANTA